MYKSAVKNICKNDVPFLYFFQELLLCILQHLGKVMDQYFWTMWSAQEMNPTWLNASIQALLDLNSVIILRMQGLYAQVKYTTYITFQMCTSTKTHVHIIDTMHATRFNQFFFLFLFFLFFNIVYLSLKHSKYSPYMEAVCFF